MFAAVDALLRRANRSSSRLGPGRSFVEEKAIRRFPGRINLLCKSNPSVPSQFSLVNTRGCDAGVDIHRDASDISRTVLHVDARFDGKGRIERELSLAATSAVPVPQDAYTNCTLKFTVLPIADSLHAS